MQDQFGGGKIHPLRRVGRFRWWLAPTLRVAVYFVYFVYFFFFFYLNSLLFIVGVSGKGGFQQDRTQGS